MNMLNQAPEPTIPGAGAGAGAGAEGVGTEGNQELNPIMDALKTLQLFVAGQKEQGNAAADQMAAGLLQFIQAVSGGAGGAGAGGAGGGDQQVQPAQSSQPRPEMAGPGSRAVIPSL